MKEKIIAVCREMEEFLVAKNEAYGNSAAEPVRIFSRADPEEQIMVRLDDKLSRLAKGNEYAGDDTIKDLAGYLLLLMAIRESDRPKTLEELVGGGHYDVDHRS